MPSAKKDTWIGAQGVPLEIRSNKTIPANLIFDYKAETDAVLIVLKEAEGERLLELPFAKFEHYFNYIAEIRKNGIFPG